MTKGVHQLLWESKGTVRSRPRIILDRNQQGYFFPLSRQPLCVHPLIENLGYGVRAYLLAQSFYKYTNDIAIIETRVVNQAILSVLGNALVIDFSSEHKINLHTIMVDEAYHAYVAFDAMMQIQAHTNIEPLELPKVIEIELAIKTIAEKLQPQYRDMFVLIAVCLAENTLTKDIVSMLDQEETHPFFQKLISDHLSDEKRHANVFFHLLKYIWLVLPDDYKLNIGVVLPEFLTLYLRSEVQIQFDKCALFEIGLKKTDVDAVIYDTYGDYKITRHHPILKNILSFLDKAGVLDEVVLPKFKEKNWL